MICSRPMDSGPKGRRCLTTAGVAAFLLVLLGACGRGAPDLDEAWQELRDPGEATDPRDPERRLLLARMVLEANRLPSGARARFPLGFAHLVEVLSGRDTDSFRQEDAEPSGDGSVDRELGTLEHRLRGGVLPRAGAGPQDRGSLFREFDRLSQAISAGTSVRADLRLDVERVEAGSRVALEQQVDLRSAGKTGDGGSFLWVPARAPGFPQTLGVDDLRIDVAAPGGGWRRLELQAVRPGAVGPLGFSAGLPLGAERLRVIYGDRSGVSMPLRAGNHRLPLWLGEERDIVYALGASILEVGSAEPAEVRVHGPSVVRPGEVFSLELRRADRFGNEVEETVRPAMELWSDGSIERRFPAGDGTRLTVGGLSRAETGVVRYRVSSADGLVGWSPPMVVREHGPRLRWGDPASPLDQCVDGSSNLDFQTCIRWAGCASLGAGEEGCRVDAAPGALWLDRVRFDASIREDWRDGIERHSVGGSNPGVLVFATLKMLRTGAVRLPTVVADRNVSLFGSALTEGGWPATSITARPPVAAVWSEGIVDGSPSAHSAYATTGARILVDCQRAELGTESSRCAVHGTAPIWRLDVLLPGDEPSRPAPSLQDWQVVEQVRPLRTKERSLLIVAWSSGSDGPSPTELTEGELSVPGGGVSAVALFGDSVEATRLGSDGLSFRQLAPPVRGGLLVDLGGPRDGDRVLRLALRVSDREEYLDFLAREVPFRRPLEAGWIETDWVEERPVLDVEASFPDLSPADAARALVLVQQVDGEVAVARFQERP